MAAMISSCVRPNSVRAVLSLSVAPLRPHSSESRSMTGDYLAWRRGAEGTLVEPLNMQQPGRGIDDGGRREAEALARDARHAGVDVRVERYAADTHVFHMFWSFLPEAADAVGQVGGFVSGLLRAAPAAAGDHTANLPSASPRPRPSPRQI